jgi:hypothetical protein
VFCNIHGHQCLLQTVYLTAIVCSLLLDVFLLRGLSPQANYIDRATAAVGEVVPTFAGRGCYVVSATDSVITHSRVKSTYILCEAGTEFLNINLYDLHTSKG